jgi:transposase
VSRAFDSDVLREYAFAIADADSVEDLPSALVVERLVPKILTSSAHLMPTLIYLRQSPEHALNALSDLIRNACAHAQVPPATLLIKTNACAKDIARHWNAMQIAQPQRRHKLWLRLHDVRVLHQMLRVLNPMQRRKMFGLSLAITYCIGGEWITAERDLNYLPGTQSSAHGDVEPYAGPERWDWPRIERIGLVNRVLHGADVRVATALTSAGALAEQLMERAAGRYGLVNNADLIEFAIRGLQTNPTFDEHPSVARLIKGDTKSAEESSLSDRFALVEDEIWHALREPMKIPKESQI